MRVIALIVACVGSIGMLSAQAPPQSPASEAPLAFEIASVKPNKSGANLSLRSGNTGFTAIAMPLRMVIMQAYGFRGDRIVGGDRWIDSDRFDIVAKSPFDNATDHQIALMLRPLLAERFKLVVRTETRDAPIFELVVARRDGKLGPNLKPSSTCNEGSVSLRTTPTGVSPKVDPSTCGTRRFVDINGTSISGGGRSPAEIARALDGVGGRRVIDRTGLSGTFNYELRFGPTNPLASQNSDLPDVYTAVEEQLGLKLVPSRAGGVPGDRKRGAADAQLKCTRDLLGGGYVRQEAQTSHLYGLREAH